MATDKLKSSRKNNRLDYVRLFNDFEVKKGKASRQAFQHTHVDDQMIAMRKKTMKQNITQLKKVQPIDGEQLIRKLKQHRNWVQMYNKTLLHKDAESMLELIKTRNSGDIWSVLNRLDTPQEELLLTSIPAKNMCLSCWKERIKE